MVILVDDEDRENEGDLTMAAQLVTPQAINFMARYGRGLICLSLTEERADELDLPLMVRENTSSFKTAFTVSIEAAEGTQSVTIWSHFGPLSIPWQISQIPNRLQSRPVRGSSRETGLEIWSSADG